MGGKSKQANRTKNNVRPSSSGRSAEQLSGVGPLPPSAGTLSALFPSLAVGNPDAALTSDFALCVKKLNKKDPITKTKALQELIELIQNSKADDVVALLPNWTHFYKILSVDSDRKLRELTQVCHGVIAATCGRRLAPALKALLPSWLQAQYDDHAPARARAQLTLNSTFPGKKLPDAIAFCKEEVVTHLLDNLLNTNAAISKKLEGAEERAEAAERVAGSSVRGLRYLCAHLPDAELPWLWGRLQPLFKSGAFWKLAQSTAPYVRAAWCELVGVLAARLGAQWADVYGGKALKQLLRGPDPPVAPQLWAAILDLMKADPEWYSRLEKKETLQRRVIELLESGGWGEARRTADTVAALLPLLPDHALSADFYTAFFDACFVGLQRKNVASSKAEFAAWLGLVAECVRWVFARGGGAAAGAALREWTRAALGAALATGRPAAPLRPSAALQAALLRRWLREAAAEPGPRADAVDHLVRSFWHDVASTLCARLDAAVGGAELTAVLDAGVMLLQALDAGLLQEPKKRQNIKFEDDERTPRETEETTEPETEPPLGESLRARCTRDVERAVRTVAGHALELAARSHAVREALGALLPLLKERVNPELLAALAEPWGGGGARTLWDRALRPWLLGPATRCPEALDLAFLLLPHLSDEDCDAVFDSFSELPLEVVQWAVPRCAAPPGRAPPAARRWLRSPAPLPALLAAARRAHTDAPARTLLLAVMGHGEPPDDEPLVSAETLDELVRTVVCELETALGSRREEAGGAARLAALLAPVLAGHAPPPHHYDHLITALFNLTLNTTAGEVVDSNTWLEARFSWQDGLLALEDDKKNELTDKYIRALQEHMHKQAEEVSPLAVEHAASLLVHLVGGDAAPSAVAAVSRRALPAPADPRRSVLPHAERHAALASRLHYPLPHHVAALEATDLPTRVTIATFLRNLLARAVFLRAALRACSTPATILKDPEIVEIFAEVLYDCAILDDLIDGYAFWADYNMIETTSEKIKVLIEVIVSDVDEAGETLTRTLVTERAAARGGHWAYAALYYRRLLAGPADPAADDQLLDTLQDAVTGDGFFHMLQAEASSQPEREDLRVQSAYLVMVRALLAADAADPGALTAGGCTPSLEPALTAHYQRLFDMLFDTDLSTRSWLHCVCASSVVECCTALVEARGWDLPSEHWDFINIALSSLLTSVHMSQNTWTNTKVAMVTRSVLRLHRAVERFVREVPAESERRQPAPHVAALPREWADVFAPHLTRTIAAFTFYLLEEQSRSPVSVGGARVLSQLCRSLQRVRWAELGAPPGDLRPGRGARAAVCALAAPLHHAYKYLAYYTLGMLTDALVLEDAEKLRAWSGRREGEGEEEGEQPEVAVDYFHRDLLQLQDLVDASLVHLRVGEETCSMSPGSDAHSLALGWLLMHASLGAMGRRQHSDLAMHYLERFRARRYSDRLLPAALRLLPPALAAFATANVEPRTPPPATDLFDDVPLLDVDKPSLASHVAELSCHCMKLAVSGAGAAGARGWYGAASKPAARALQRLVRAYVSPGLIRAQLQQVAERAGELEDTEVTVLWACGEVLAAVLVEERRLELGVALAADHPLSLPRVSAPRAHAHSAAPPSQWLALYLGHRNGSLLAALRLWAAAVSARVDAAPQCYICYCRLHPSSGRLPSVLCSQCRNKFHDPCLRKWFVSSNKSNCPLCRFNF